MEYEHRINAASWNLWGKVIDQTLKNQSFTIVIEGLAKKAIGNYIEDLVDENYDHTDAVLAQSWWFKYLYIYYYASVSTAIEQVEEEGYSIYFEYTEKAVFVHCKANSWMSALGRRKLKESKNSQESGDAGLTVAWTR